ncbi:MAG: MASE1 domain-containing protein [Microcoleus vaginatus WJT46-NPBG5]|jgi:signal transduction histidine kinase|nr:MASE1 domain-containing protein [Microcoleus vaginatus WJT46-NPBG5]
MKAAPHPNWLLKGLIILLLAFAYYFTAELGRRLASTPQNVTPVWPPDGFASAGILIFGYWVWPGVWLGSFLANVWAFFDKSSAIAGVISIAKASSIGIGTTLGTLLGGFLLRCSIGNRNPLNHPQDVFKLIFFTSMVGPMVNASAGVITLCLAGNVPWAIFPTVWLTWWISNVAGILIFTPFLICWSYTLANSRQRIRAGWQWIKKFRTRFDADSLAKLTKSLAGQRVAEVILLSGLVLTLSLITFWQGTPVEYMLIPVLVLAAFRFGQRGTTLLIVLVAVVAVLGTVNGQGSFVRENFNDSLVLLQSFIGVIVLTTLTLTAVITQQRKAEDTLRQSEADIRQKSHDLEYALSELKRTQVQLIQGEKMSILGQLVAGVAHEINNPVNFITGNLDHANDYIEDLLNLIGLYQEHYPHPVQAIEDKTEEIELAFLLEDLPKLLSSMRIGAERICKIVVSLRTFSRIDEAEFKAVDIHAGIDSTLLILESRLKAKPERPAIQVIKEYGNFSLVECYPGQLNQVFMNILVNAIDALEERDKERTFAEMQQLPSEICISTEITSDHRVAIKIADNGPGIPEQVKQRIFEPFFTTKPACKGTGMGMSISYQIVTEAHGGLLQCYSWPGKGTEFVIEIPLQKQQSDDKT